jgi:hypothetical protein
MTLNSRGEPDGRFCQTALHRHGGHRDARRRTQEGGRIRERGAIRLRCRMAHRKRVLPLEWRTSRGARRLAGPHGATGSRHDEHWRRRPFSFTAAIDKLIHETLKKAGTICRYVFHREGCGSSTSVRRGRTRARREVISCLHDMRSVVNRRPAQDSVREIRQHIAQDFTRANGFANHRREHASWHKLIARPHRPGNGGIGYSIRHYRVTEDLSCAEPCLWLASFS